MGALDIVEENLISGIVRMEETNDTGIFTLNGAGSLVRDDEGGWLGQLGRILSGLARAAYQGVGWLINKAKMLAGLRFGFRDIFGAFVQTYFFIKNFNWNATDAQLDAQLNAIKFQLASQLGGTAGNLAGWLVCGVLPSSAMLYFNEPLGIKLLKEVGEEALDEFIGNLNALLQTGFRAYTQWFLITAFKSIRNLIKWASKDPESLAARALNQIGFSPEEIQSWGASGGKPWTFAQQVQKFVDSIENPFTQEFLEEFLEEFEESCIEAGYVIAGGLDNWVLQQRLTRNNLLGNERIIQITPNREAPDERIILAGPESLVKQQATTVLTHYQLVENRNVGQLVGESLRQRATKIKSPLTLFLQWAYFPSEPFYRNGITYLPECHVPGIKRSKLDWEVIKFAMGGSNGYFWGRFKAHTSLVDTFGNKVHECKIFGGTAAEAEDRLRALLTLSDYEIRTFSVTEELREGVKANGRALQKETAKIYPAYMTLLNTQKIENEENGRTELTGTYIKRKDRVPMWTSTKPYDFEETIQNILAIPGQDV